MRLNDYITRRDRFIQTEVYVQFRDPLLEAGYSKEQCDEMVKTAFRNASDDWRRAQADIISRAVDDISLPDSNR